MVSLEVQMSYNNNNDSIKGALDNFSLIPQFFFKKVQIFIPLEVYTYVVTACSILLNYKDVWFFLSVAIFKSRLPKMAATVMAV